MTDAKKDGTLSEAQAAKLLGLSRRTLANHRYHRTGPPYRRFDRGKPRICYDAEEVRRWRGNGTNTEK